jgi:hypothetical protein
MDRAEARAGPEDVGEQALMRGLDTAFSVFVWGCPGLMIRGVDQVIGHIVFVGNSPFRSPALTADLMSSVFCLVYSSGCLFHPLTVLFDRDCNAGLWAGRAVHDTSGPQPRATLRLPTSHDLAIDRPNEGR